MEEKCIAFFNINFAFYISFVFIFFKLKVFGKGSENTFFKKGFPINQK